MDSAHDRSAGGGLYETEFDRHPLGRFHERDLTAIVRRRRIRIALGGRRALRIELGEARPVAIEVTSTAGDDGAAVERIEVPHVPSPRVQLAKRVALLWVAAATVLWIARRLRAY